MSKFSIGPLLWGVSIALYLRFGLEPTAWLFYEASFFLDVDWLYWGYSLFRGGAHVLSLWAYQTQACILTGTVIYLLIQWRSRSKQ